MKRKPFREKISKQNEDENEDENEKETWNVHFHTQDTPILDDFKYVIAFSSDTLFRLYLARVWVCLCLTFSTAAPPIMMMMMRNDWVTFLKAAYLGLCSCKILSQSEHFFYDVINCHALMMMTRGCLMTFLKSI